MPALRHFPKRLRLLHEDDAIIVAEKEAGFLSCDIRGGSRPNALDALSDYLKRGVAKSRSRAWLVHRLDRETSGVMVFAKSLEIREKLQSRWNETEKRYLAAVDGVPPPEGRLENWLHESEDGGFFVRCLPRARPGAKNAILEYRVIAARAPSCALLEVGLVTGRKNQIRVQFASAGHPVLGDSKYGRRARMRAPRLMLHAMRLAFPHPVTGRRMEFASEPPREFERMFPDAFR